MKAWYAISVLFLCFACFFAGRYSVEKQIEVVKETDTINKPVPEPSYILDVEEIELPYPIFVYQKGDTVKELDTIYIPLPIQRKVYETDLYRAVVSVMSEIFREDLLMENPIRAQEEVLFI